MKQKVLVNLKVICDPPKSIKRWANSLKDEGEQLDSWCREFEEFIRDHRSQDPIYLYVDREYQDQCSHCGNEWEEDKDGLPMCCDEAQQEYFSNKEIVL